MTDARGFKAYIITLFLITLCLRIVLIGYYDYNLGGIEPNVIYGIQRLLLGQPLYQDPSSGTYAIMQYTPLWYYTVAGTARLLSPDALDHGLNVQGIYEFSRTLALVCNLLTVFISACIIRSFRFSWPQSLLLAMPLLVILTPHYYTRGDSLHILLFILSLFAYVLYSRENKALYAALAALLTAACILTKQSGILVAGIIGAGLLFVHRKYAVTLLYIGCLFIFLLLIACVLQSGTWYDFYQNTVLGLKNGIDTSFLYTIFISPYFLELAPCYALGAALLVAAGKNTSDKPYHTILRGMAFSWLFAVVTGLKIGSSSNYFTEFLVLLFIAVPVFLRDDKASKKLILLFHRPVTARHLANAALLILLTSKASGMLTAVCIEKSFKNKPQEYAGEQRLYAYLQDTLHIKPSDRVFFTERRYLDNIFVKYAAFPTKDVVTQVYMASPATFNYSGFTRSADKGLVNYIVTDARRDDINICNDSLPFIWFDKGKFILVARISGYAVYSWQPDRDCDL